MAPESAPATAAGASADDILAATRRWDLPRAGLIGTFEGAFLPNGLFLLVTVQHFAAGPALKALVAAGHAFGLLATLGVLTLVGRRGWPITRAVAACYLLAAAALATGALFPSLPTFLFAALVGTPLVVMCIPLITATWRQNCPDDLRGRYFSQSLRAGRAAAIVAALAIAWWLGADAGRYPGPLLMLAVLVALAGVAAARIPSRPVAAQSRNPFAALRWLWRDRLFGYVSAAWMLMGLGMLTTLPLRVEYAASPTAGLGLGAGLALTINIILPLLMQLIAMPFWGRWFDRANFIVLRIALNGTMCASVVLFFLPTVLAMSETAGLGCLIAGNLLLGFGQGGGTIAWNLWVTKYSPADRTADYMTVHTFLTGTRAAIAPAIGFTVAAVLGVGTMAAIGGALMLLSVLMLAPVIRLGDSRTRVDGAAT